MSTTDTTCTCPSGDGSLRWPCPTHPPTERDERLRDIQERHEERSRDEAEHGFSVQPGSIADDVRYLLAEVTRLDAVVTAVRKICAEHWDYQARRGAKFGRKGSDCLCEICQVVRVLDGGAA